jgi:hypothetical protein
MDLSIIIVSFNTRQMTLACLQSVFDQTRDAGFEVIVVDNASADGSPQALAERFPQARLIALDHNAGFAKANNLAAEQAHGERLLLLNSDTVVLDRAIDRMLAFAQRHGEAQVFAGRTVFADGSLNRTSCWGRPRLWTMACFGLGLTKLADRLPMLDPETMRGWQRDDVRRVDIVSGCFMLIDRGLWRRLDGFDTDFFMYGEDFDLCLRARRLGAQCLFCPDATIIHHGGASKAAESEKVIRIMAAKQRLMRKHWRLPSRLAGAALLRMHVLVRMLGFSAARRLRPNSGTWDDRWRQAWLRRCEWSSLTTDRAV